MSFFFVSQSPPPGPPRPGSHLFHFPPSPPPRKGEKLREREKALGEVLVAVALIKPRLGSEPGFAGSVSGKNIIRKVQTQTRGADYY